MIKAKSVLLTTNPAKDGSQFDIGELERALMQGAVSGIASCLGHDSAKPAAWTVPFALFLEPNIGRLAGITWLPEDVAEQTTINTLHHNAIIARTLADFEPYRSQFEEELKDKLSKDYQILSSTFVGCVDPGIVNRSYPALLSKVDKDGLLYLTDLLEDFSYLGQGVFADKKSGFAVCAHGYFRRSLFRQNNLNFYFLDTLMGYYGKPDLTLRIRLDTDVIGVAKSYIPAMEYEHWRGPYFSDDVSDIKLGVAEYKMDEYNKLFNGIGRTEFWWKMESGEQAFEAEEVKEVPSLGISHDDYGCRYAHSIYDTEHEVFEHFDGAIRMYDSDMILQRWDRDIKSAGKSSIYTKLFRVDGKLPLADWKLLLHHYFQGNSLIGEYLGGPDYLSDNEPAFADSEPRPLLDSLVPLTMAPMDGLRIAISYLPAEEYPEEIGPDLYLEGHDTFDDRELKKTVEIDIIEIRKALLREGHQLHIPADYQLIDCDDGMQWNIPEIAMTDRSRVIEQLPALIKAVADVLAAKNNPLQTVAFTCSWPAADKRKTVLSVLGASQTMTAWIRQFPSVPSGKTGFSGWLKAQEVWLRKFNSTFDVPRLNDVLCDDGTLFIKRHPIFKYMVPGSISFEGKMFNMALKPEFEELYQLILAKRIAYSPVYHVKKMLCKQCGQNYFDCLHSQPLDGTGTDIKDFQVVGHYWVNVN